MNLSQKFIIGLAGAACLALAAWNILARRTHQGLTNEFADLRRQNQDVARLQNENEHLDDSIAKLVELRKSQIDALLTRPAAAAPIESQAQAATKFVSVADLRNAGTNTVRDTFETYFWALDHLDEVTLARVLNINKGSLAKIKDLYDSLPQADQARYGTAQQMFAMIYASQHPIYFSAMSLSTDEPAADTQYLPLTTQYEYSNGHITEHHNLQLIRMADGGWSVDVHPQLVDQSLKQLDH